ncbi:hypothetical protein [Streptomyces sp. NPDC058751]
MNAPPPGADAHLLPHVYGLLPSQGDGGDLHLVLLRRVQGQ